MFFLNLLFYILDHYSVGQITIIRQQSLNSLVIKL